MSVLNLNVGILGHVDCGKTTLSKALSTVASTAAYDKHPQSQERGITLDLGFSSFSIKAPECVSTAGYSSVQFTLVDCPGHASLIRTIIGGAQIIDLMILVIDIAKGIQTQTGECLIIGEITCDKMIVALNKIDTLDDQSKERKITRMRKQIKTVLSETKFVNSQIVCISALNNDVSELKLALEQNIFLPKRDIGSGTFLFYVDHCFPVRGQGTILTGTVISGSAKVGTLIEIPSLKSKHTIRSIQVFHKAVQEISVGDRAGICVTQLDPVNLERGIVCSLNSTQQFSVMIARMKPVRYFRRKIACGDKFHVTVAYSTIMARLIALWEGGSNFDIEKNYPLLSEVTSSSSNIEYFVLLEFETPVICLPDTIMIASRLDSDINANACRIAFHGRLIIGFKTKQDINALKIYKTKQKNGIVERILNEQTLICVNMFKRETNINAFCGLSVELSTGEKALIDSGFGQTGKCKLYLTTELSEKAKTILNNKKAAKKGKSQNENFTQDVNECIEVRLEFKKYIFQKNSKIFQ